MYKKVFEDLAETIRKRDVGVDCVGITGSEKGLIVSGLFDLLKLPVVVILPTSKDAEKFIEDLEFFEGKEPVPVVYFQPYNILPFKSLSYHSETASKRIRTLYRLIEGSEIPLVVTTVEAVMQKIVPMEELSAFAELIMEGEEFERDEIISTLVSGGYTRSTIVEEPGDFSVRGGIIDIYSPMYDEPLRVEMFGDLVDSLSFFSPLTQRRTGRIGEAVILPAMEAILKKDQLNTVIARIRKQGADLDLPKEKIRSIVERIRDEGAFSGIESILSLVYPKLDSFFDYLPASTLFVLSGPEKLAGAADASWARVEKNFFLAERENRLCVPPEDLFMRWEKTAGVLKDKKPLTLKALSVLKEGSDKAIVKEFAVEDNLVLSGELKNTKAGDALLEPLARWVDEKSAVGYKVLLVSGSRSQMDRMDSLVAPYGIDPGFVQTAEGVQNKKGNVFSCIGRVSSGFVWPELSLAVITENEIFGKKRRRIVSPNKKKGRALLTFEDMKEGDVVVHFEHGLGRYDGLVKLKLGLIDCDFLLVTYKDDDKLYLPVDKMNMLQKYMGVDGYKPVLDKMGGKSWQKIKDKAKKEVEKIAGELLNLYAQRSVNKGHAFSKSDSWYRDFEASFPYEETPDQYKAIDEVISDMEKSTPMDRLVCGDVGYGKTEVAIRAAFKAVNDGKQAAVLVPTTVLAEQHAKTFNERFIRYPVKIASLNRFRSAGEQRKIIADIALGKIDIVIGTHRILQKDIEFKDLGLVVVDEEQRFGVKHKEKLKRLRSTVDVLTLTATPIPRTLHMSLTGMRDISVISTPPEQRQAIITYVSEFDDAVISEAVRRELARGGQIYFVHNNINTIWNIADYLQKLIPELKIGVAHGRLNERELEKEMLNFIDKKIDMLVCTTIIESGLDIPAANTMLVNRADRFGLSQMYQLRGRVGRGDDQAYAYLFIPEESTLGKDAQKRLKVLMEHSDLGSGFQIAMSDLQIRGGGAALGASQSGHIAAVGYDMFLKLMEDAIADIKGEPVVEQLDPEINVGISTYIPESYIPAIDQRLSIYRRLAKMKTLKEISGLKGELEDRFGSIPEEAGNVLLKIMLKVLAVNAGVKKLDLGEQQMSLAFSEIHQKKPFGIVQMISSGDQRFNFTPDRILKVKLTGKSINAMMASAKNILKEIAGHVNR